jgi:NADPH:quinone reductase-like Zn-dependent oxidoreductase
MMRVAMIHQAGGPEVLKLEALPLPVPEKGQILIRVKAFGLNRSELFTRQGHSPGVRFPIVLGIEATGIVESAPGGEFVPGQTVATAMGGMGRQFNGGYAEYTCVPATQVQAISTDLPWETLGAIPEMLQTSWGALFRSLKLVAGDRLLIRGGTTSVGLAAAAIARKHGATVMSTTRAADRQDLLRSAGAHETVVDSGEIASEVRARFAGGADKVLELVGTGTLEDSLQCARVGGVVCMAGMVGNRWTLPDFEPMVAIPSGTCLTTYIGGVEDFMATPLQTLADDIAKGALRIQIGHVFQLPDIVEAHRCMEENTAQGKLVVLT